MDIHKYAHCIVLAMGEAKIVFRLTSLITVYSLCEITLKVSIFMLKGIWVAHIACKFESWFKTL